jgi:hypothetical protein
MGLICSTVLKCIKLDREEDDEPLAATLSIKSTTLHLVNVTTISIRRITISSLAVELIDAIIGHVDQKDDMSRSHLLTCSLVCRFWLPSSQRRLFHHIKFEQWWVDRLPAQITRLDQVLLNSPHLASYIRVLEIPEMPRCQLSLHRYQRPGSIAIDKLLSPLLSKITQVQKLRISHLTWNDLPGDFRQSLCRLLELPSMALVCLYDAKFICMDDFTNFINHARGSTALSLNHIYVPWVLPHPLKVGTKHAEDNEERFERRRISHLTRLDMTREEYNSVFVNWLLGPLSNFGVSHIHTLHINLPDIEEDSVNKLLCAIGNSLKHVFISLPYTCE